MVSNSHRIFFVFPCSTQYGQTVNMGAEMDACQNRLDRRRPCILKAPHRWLARLLAPGPRQRPLPILFCPKGNEDASGHPRHQALATFDTGDFWLTLFSERSVRSGRNLWTVEKVCLKRRKRIYDAYVVLALARQLFRRGCVDFECDDRERSSKIAWAIRRYRWLASRSKILFRQWPNLFTSYVARVLSAGVDAAFHRSFPLMLRAPATQSRQEAQFRAQLSQLYSDFVFLHNPVEYRNLDL